MNKQYILFDLDGTLTDPYEGITKGLQLALESIGIIVEDRRNLNYFVGPPLRETLMSSYSLSFETAEKTIKKYREYYSVTGIFENEIYDGIPELLEKLYKDGKTLILATSKPAVFAKRILEFFGLREYFTFVSGSELDNSRTDKAEVIAYALEEMGITERERAIMIGDREHDIIGAKKNALESIGVLYGFGSREELSKAGAEYLAENITALSSLLFERFTKRSI